MLAEEELILLLFDTWLVLCASSLVDYDYMMSHCHGVEGHDYVAACSTLRRRSGSGSGGSGGVVVWLCSKSIDSELFLPSDEGVTLQLPVAGCGLQHYHAKSKCWC